MTPNIPPAAHPQQPSAKAAALASTAIPSAAEKASPGPTPDEPLLTRWQALKLVNALGFPLTEHHFNKLCLPSRKTGPIVACRWGLRPMYRAADVKAWCYARSSHPADQAVA